MASQTTPVAPRCTHCGRSTPPTVRLCPHCGRLNWEPRPATAPARENGGVHNLYDHHESRKSFGETLLAEYKFIAWSAIAFGFLTSMLYCLVEVHVFDLRAVPIPAQLIREPQRRKRADDMFVAPRFALHYGYAYQGRAYKGEVQLPKARFPLGVELEFDVARPPQFDVLVDPARPHISSIYPRKSWIWWFNVAFALGLSGMMLLVMRVRYRLWPNLHRYLGGWLEFRNPLMISYDAANVRPQWSVFLRYHWRWPMALAMLVLVNVALCIAIPHVFSLLALWFALMMATAYFLRIRFWLWHCSPEAATVVSTNPPLLAGMASLAILEIGNEAITVVSTNPPLLAGMASLAIGNEAIQIRPAVLPQRDGKPLQPGDRLIATAIYGIGNMEHRFVDVYFLPVESATEDAAVLAALSARISTDRWEQFAAALATLPQPLRPGLWTVGWKDW